MNSRYKRHLSQLVEHVYRDADNWNDHSFNTGSCLPYSRPQILSRQLPHSRNHAILAPVPIRPPLRREMPRIPGSRASKPRSLSKALLPSSLSLQSEVHRGCRRNGQGGWLGEEGHPGPWLQLNLALLFMKRVKVALTSIAQRIPRVGACFGGSPQHNFWLLTYLLRRVTFFFHHVPCLATRAWRRKL